MTDMKRMTVSMPDEMVKELDALKRTKEFRNEPYSLLIRTMIQLGLESGKGGTKCQSLARKSERASSA